MMQKEFTNKIKDKSILSKDEIIENLLKGHICTNCKFKRQDYVRNKLNIFCTEISRVNEEKLKNENINHGVLVAVRPEANNTCYYYKKKYQNET